MRNQAILLSTALVNVCVGNLRFIVRVLIDTGSQATFITDACVQRLGLIRRYASVPIFGIGESKPIHPKGIVSCTLTPCNQAEPTLNIDALILNKLVYQKPCIPVPNPTDIWPHIRNLNLADPTFNCLNNQPIEMILSAHILSQVLLGQIRKGPPDSPIAMNSIFGYLLMGKISFCLPSPIQIYHSSFFEDADLQRFWELETIPDKPTLTAEEQLCETIFRDTYSRGATGSCASL